MNLTCPKHGNDLVHQTITINGNNLGWCSQCGKWLEFDKDGNLIEEKPKEVVKEKKLRKKIRKKDINPLLNYAQKRKIKDENNA